MALATGTRHGRWKGGRRIRPNGYMAITHGPYRWWYEHRMVMDICLREWNPYLTGRESSIKDIETATGIRFHVDHQDCNKLNNVPGNLIFMDARIHNSFNRFRDSNGKFVKHVVENPHEIIEGGEDV